MEIFVLPTDIDMALAVKVKSIKPTVWMFMEFETWTKTWINLLQSRWNTYESCHDVQAQNGGEKNCQHWQQCTISLSFVKFDKKEHNDKVCELFDLYELWWLTCYYIHYSVSVIVLLVENNMPLGHEMKDSTRTPGESYGCWRYVSLE